MDRLYDQALDAATNCMMLYLDTNVWIAFLYEEAVQSARYLSCLRLVESIRSGRVQAIVSFYILPELYAYLATEYAAVPFNAAFRLSLVELFRVPSSIVPHLSSTDLELWRRRIKISDSTDLPHAACALNNKCDGIVTYDFHFREISNLIPVYTPDEYLATLESSESASRVE